MTETFRTELNEADIREAIALWINQHRHPAEEIEPSMVRLRLEPCRQVPIAEIEEVVS